VKRTGPKKRNDWNGENLNEFSPFPEFPRLSRPGSAVQAGVRFPSLGGTLYESSKTLTQKLFRQFRSPKPSSII